ncbi:MAG: DUF1801 domain-containing protein [Rhizomicrobium sp.]|jgi:uncharacterized protein YdhG (YjbR/CyaY superfamily)
MICSSNILQSVGYVLQPGGFIERWQTLLAGLPAYKLRGVTVIHFAAWKSHVSLYPASAKLLAFFAKDLAAATINKSTIRFPRTEPVPVKLIARIAKFRVRELAERAKAKNA